MEQNPITVHDAGEILAAVRAIVAQNHEILANLATLIDRFPARVIIPADPRMQDAKHARRAARVAQLLSNVSLGLSDIVAATRYPREDVREVLSSLIAAGIAYETAGPRGGPRYRLTDQALARRKGELV